MGNLSRGAKAGVALAVLILVGLGLGLGLGLTMGKSGSSSSSGGGGGGGSGGQGDVKFGILSVTDTVSRNEPPKIQPGDKVELKYSIQSGDVHDLTVDWLFSTDNGQNYNVIRSDKSGNTFDYVLPADTFTSQAYFRVRDHAATGDFISSSVISVAPKFLLTRGPGVTKPNGIVFANTNTMLTFETDASLSQLTAVSDFELDYDTSNTFPSPSTFPLSGLNVANSVISYMATELVSNVYTRLKTTSLMAAGFPEELVATAEYTISVVPQASCGGTGPGPFRFCEVFMVGKDGQGKNFESKEAVSLKVAYEGTFGSTTITFAYVLGSATPVALPTTSGPVQEGNDVAVYGATLPDLDTTELKILATAGSFTSLSKEDYTVSPYLFFTPPTQVLVYPAGSPGDNEIKTTVDFSPADTGFQTSFEVGVANADGTGAEFFPVQSEVNNTTSVELTWLLTQTQIDFGSSETKMLKLGFRFSGSSGTSTVFSASALPFKKSAWSPTYAPIFNQMNLQQNMQFGTNPSGPPDQVLLWEEPTTRAQFFPTQNLAAGGNTICQFTGGSPESFPCWSEFVGMFSFGEIQPAPLGGANTAPSTLKPTFFNPNDVPGVPNVFFFATANGCIVRTDLPGGENFLLISNGACQVGDVEGAWELR